MNRRFFLTSLCSLGVLPLAGFVQKLSAAIGSPVVWAGVTYLAHNEGRLTHARGALDASVPHVSGTVNQTFTRALSDVLPNLPQINLVLDPEELSTQARPEYGFTLALAHEVIGFADESEGTSRYNCLLIGYGFVYHIFEKRVEYSFPVRVQHTVAADGAVDLNSIFVGMLAGVPDQGLQGMNSYLATLMQRQPFQIRDENQWRFQVMYPQEMDRLDADTAKMGIEKSDFLDWIGFSVTDAFSSRLGVPVSPFRDSRATGDLMVVRFPTGSETLAMDIPAPDYEIVPLVRGWAVQEKAKDNGSGLKMVSIIAGLNLDVRFAGDSDSFFAQRFRIKLDYLESPDGKFDPLLRVGSMYERLLTDLFDAVAGNGDAYQRVIKGETVKLGQTSTIAVSLHGDDVAAFDSQIARLQAELPS